MEHLSDLEAMTQWKNASYTTHCVKTQADMGVWINAMSVFDKAIEVDVLLFKRIRDVRAQWSGIIHKILLALHQSDKIFKSSRSVTDSTKIE